MKRYFYVVLILFTIIGVSFFVFRKEEKKEKKTYINYYDKVIVNDESKLYKLVDGKFVSTDLVYKDVVFDIDGIKDKYYYIPLLDSYIYYKDVSECKIKFYKDTRYKNYIVFNKNIETKSGFYLYKDGVKKFFIGNSMNFPIIKIIDDKYYVEYFDELYYVEKLDIVNIYDNNNTVEESATDVSVTVYHFFYKDDDTSCGEIICHSESSIREQFNYLKENNYFTLTTSELLLFMNGSIRIPKNSILITIDDGSRAEQFIPLLEEYKINATLFLITSWYESSKFNSTYLELASHSNDLHNPGKCSGGQGSPIRCLDREYLINDLRISREKLNNTLAFCFPFYEFNDYSIDVVKSAGFNMAFIGGNKKVNSSTNPYLIPRYTLYNSTTLNEYISIVN